MFKTKINNLLFMFSLAVTILIAPNLILAQSSNDNPDSSQTAVNSIRTLAQDLQSKLGLTQTQTDSVGIFLQDYQSSLASSMESEQNQGTKNADAVQKVNSSIENLLNEGQKVSWTKVKTDWWSNVNSVIIPD